MGFVAVYEFKMAPQIPVAPQCKCGTRDIDEFE